MKKFIAIFVFVLCTSTLTVISQPDSVWSSVGQNYRWSGLNSLPVGMGFMTHAFAGDTAYLGGDTRLANGSLEYL